MDLAQVTLTQMRYAVAIADSESFRLAAERCHVSQSGLSMQIQKLEDLLGVSLFDRSRKPLMVTPAGARALAQMRVVLRETERLAPLLVEDSEPSGPFRLGVIPTLSATVIPLFLRTFLDRYPRVELFVEELKTDDLIQRLAADSLDAGLAATPLAEAGLHETTLAVESMYAYLPPGDPLLKKKTIAQAALEQRALWVMPEGHCFRSQVLAYCHKQSTTRPLAHFESGSFETLIRLVDAGMGATVLPALVVQQLGSRARRDRVRPLRPMPARELGLVTARVQLRATVTRALEQILRAALAGALAEQPRVLEVLPPR